jgi:hypothetical protein
MKQSSALHNFIIVAPLSYQAICATQDTMARVGSVAGPVIQATGKSTLEDGVRSGGAGSDLT